MKLTQVPYIVYKLYTDVIKELWKKGVAYKCECTRKDISKAFQNFDKNFQIFLINDASLDRTIDHLKKIENNFPDFVKIIDNTIKNKLRRIKD